MTSPGTPSSAHGQGSDPTSTVTSLLILTSTDQNVVPESPLSKRKSFWQPDSHSNAMDSGSGGDGGSGGVGGDAVDVAFEREVRSEMAQLEAELMAMKHRIEATSLIPTLTAALELQLLRQHSAAVSW
jgi:hypothetical protein